MQEKYVRVQCSCINIFIQHETDNHQLMTNFTCQHKILNITDQSCRDILLTNSDQRLLGPSELISLKYRISEFFLTASIKNHPLLFIFQLYCKITLRLFTVDIEALATPYIFKVKTVHFKFNLLGSGVSQRCYAVVLIKKKVFNAAVSVWEYLPSSRRRIISSGTSSQYRFCMNSLFVRPAP